LTDIEIIDLYFARTESAISETAKKYYAYCITISMNILNNREDSEECVNDTFLKAWNIIPPHMSLNPFGVQIKGSNNGLDPNEPFSLSTPRVSIEIENRWRNIALLGSGGGSWSDWSYFYPAETPIDVNAVTGVIVNGVRIEPFMQAQPTLEPEIPPANIGAGLESISIDLSYSSITNSILENMITTGEIPQNTYALFLQGNELSNIASLHSLTELTVLFLNNNLLDDITSADSLTKLEWLDLSYNDISDLTPLKSLTRLAVLNINGNNVSDEQLLELEEAMPNLIITTAGDALAIDSSSVIIEKEKIASEHLRDYIIEMDKIEDCEVTVILSSYPIRATVVLVLKESESLSDTEIQSIKSVINSLTININDDNFNIDYADISITVSIDMSANR